MRRPAVFGPALAVVLGGVALLGGGVLFGACVDTELGLDATVQAARVEVLGDAVTVSIDIDYRVGEHAEGNRVFQPQAIELYVGGALVATITPEAPPGFVPGLSPGDSRSATLGGTNAMVSGASTLCGGGEVVVLFRWLDGATLEIGMTEASTTDVACSG